MRYFKLVTDGLIVDAIRDDDAQWIVENRHNYSTYTGSQSAASGVLSTDGSKVWHIDGKPAFHDFPDYATVQMIEIEEAEYSALIEELIENGVIEARDDGENPQSGAENDSEPKAAKSRAVLALEEQVAALIKQNEMLTECLLEMSEIVYGE